MMGGGIDDYTKLYVASIHPNITEDNLRLLFEPYGAIEALSLQMDPTTHKSKGSALVQYKEHICARKALDQLNGLELAGLNVCAHAYTLAHIEGPQIRVGVVTDRGMGGSSLDDADTLGMAMSAQSRTDLMLKLARDTDLVRQAPQAMPLHVPSAEPTPYVLLANLYTMET